MNYRNVMISELVREAQYSTNQNELYEILKEFIHRYQEGELVTKQYAEDLRTIGFQDGQRELKQAAKNLIEDFKELLI